MWAAEAMKKGRIKRPLRVGGWRDQGGAGQQNLVHFFLRAGGVQAADGRDFAGQAVKGRFIQLAFGIGLLALIVAAVQVAHHFGDGQQIARVDLAHIPAPGATTWRV